MFIADDILKVEETTIKMFVLLSHVNKYCESAAFS